MTNAARVLEIHAARSAYPVGSLVLVRGSWSRPWRARIVVCGPRPSYRTDGMGAVSEDHVLALPIEPGKGWSRVPVELRKSILVPISEGA